jgi:hypothetical protein
MRRILASLTLIAMAAVSLAQTSHGETSPDKKVTAESGVIYMTKEGRVLNKEELGAAIRMGVPIHIQFTPRGRKMVVERVVVDNDGTATLSPGLANPRLKR